MHWIGRTAILLALLVIGLALALPRISPALVEPNQVDHVTSEDTTAVSPGAVPSLPSDAPHSDDNQSPSPLKNDLTRTLDGMIQTHDQVFQDSQSGLRDRLQDADQRLSSIKSEIRDALQNANRQIRPPGQLSPTVLLVLVEGIRKTDLGFYSKAGRTPLLEGIAEGGTVFDACYAGPSPEIARYMLLTGQGHNPGATRQNQLAEMMWKSGYRTILLDGSRWLQPIELHAFDQQVSLDPAPDNKHPTEFTLNGSVAKVLANQNDDPADDLSANQLLVEQARHITDTGHSNASRPAYIQLHLSIDAEDPNERRKMIDEFDLILGRWIHSLEDKKGGSPFIMALAGLPPESNLPEAEKNAASLKEAALQVPLMIYRSRQHLAHRIDKPCALIDVLPTLADSIQSARVPRNSGTSLLAWMQTGADATSVERAFRWRDPKNTARVAIRQGPWKAIFDRTRQLYYLPDDPEEQRNVADENPAVLKTLAKLGKVEI